MKIPSAIISYTNYLIIGFIILFIINGFRKGFVSQIFSLLATAVAILLSWFFAPVLASLIEVYPAVWSPFANTDLADIFFVKMNELSWYAILFITVLLLLMMLKPIVKSLAELPVLNIANRMLGVVVGLIPAIMILALTSYFLSTPLVKNGKDVVEATMFKQISNVTVNVVDLFGKPFERGVAIQKLTSDPLSLSAEEVTMIWEWLISENVDEETIEQFLSERSGRNTEIEDVKPE